LVYYWVGKWEGQLADWKGR
jgi:hypothetical protein